ncbi:hypothetical protein ACX1C1_04070 [Paenibacillus sp. strain BS8-2]
MINRIERLSWKGCTDLERSILQTKPGEWSHRIDGRLVRMERKAKAPNGQVRVFYRSADGAGSYSESEWNREAQEIEFRQLTMF